MNILVAHKEQFTSRTTESQFNVNSSSPGFNSSFFRFDLDQLCHLRAFDNKLETNQILALISHFQDLRSIVTDTHQPKVNFITLSFATFSGQTNSLDVVGFSNNPKSLGTNASRSLQSTFSIRIA